jgi:hypothetical protein
MWGKVQSPVLQGVSISNKKGGGIPREDYDKLDLFEE